MKFYERISGEEFKTDIEYRNLKTGEKFTIATVDDEFSTLIVNCLNERDGLIEALRKIANRKTVDGEKLSPVCMANIASKALAEAQE